MFFLWGVEKNRMTSIFKKCEKCNQEGYHEYNSDYDSDFGEVQLWLTCLACGYMEQTEVMLK